MVICTLVNTPRLGGWWWSIPDVVMMFARVRRLKLIQLLEKPIYTSRWKIRKNMLSNLSFVISGN